MSSESSDFDIDELRRQESLSMKPPQAKKRRENLKWVPVGFFILSFYVLSYHLGTLYQALFAIYLLYVVPKELLSVGRDPQKDGATNQRWLDQGLWFIILFLTLPY